MSRPRDDITCCSSRWMIYVRCWDAMDIQRCTPRTSMLSRGAARALTGRIANFRCVTLLVSLCSPGYVQTRQALWRIARFFVKPCQTLSRCRSISRRTAITRALSVKSRTALLPIATLGVSQIGHLDTVSLTENRFGKHLTLETMNSATDRLQNTRLKF